MNGRDRLLKTAELAVHHRTERWTADAWIALDEEVRTNPHWCVDPAAMLVKAGLTTKGGWGDAAMREVLVTLMVRVLLSLD